MEEKSKFRKTFSSFDRQFLGFSDGILAGLWKQVSTCPVEQFETKNLDFFFEISFMIWSNDFWNSAEKFRRQDCQIRL